MSRLRELRLHGFKSFADPTRFVFEPGVNAVIGPNGSGKSNMADAVRWVLGEQSNRSLRTRRADDVIFAGSEQRKPQGMAEAILTLDNADGWLPIEFAEVSIGRRAYRSGESEYLINGARARLRDVVELLGEGRLGANELVVVGQGTVDAALSLRPEERRQLFEEAAGVKGLQVKRNEASVRLAKALDNLSRVSDLVAELKPQARRLAMQAEHQQQHDSLVARARALVVASHRRREQTARAALGEARRAAAAAESALAAHREHEQAERRAVSEAEERYWAADEAARAAARSRAETRETLIRVEGSVEALAARWQELSDAVGRDQAELAEAERQLAQSDEEAIGEVDPALTRAAAAEEAWRRAVSDLAAADERLLRTEESLAEHRAHESDRIAEEARRSEEDIRRRTRHAQASDELGQLRGALELARGALDAAHADREAALAKLDQSRAALASADRERDAAQESSDRTRQHAAELTERLRAARAELSALSEPHDAASRLGHRLAAAGWAPLLDALDAPEATWAAVEAAVGGALDSTLLWGDADPRDALDGARGAARLLGPASGPADAREAAIAAVDGIRTLAEWLGDSRAPQLFHRTVVARDLDALLAGWAQLPSGWSAVTAAGDLADSRGIVVLRGRADPPGGAAARAHARRRELADAVEVLEQAAADAASSAHAASSRLRAARDAHLRTRDAQDALERAAQRSLADVEAEGAAVGRLEQRVDALTAELAELVVAGEVEKPSGSADMNALQAAAIEAREERDRLARIRDRARDAWTATRIAAEDLQTATADRRRGRALREGRVAHLRATLPERLAALTRLTEERVRAEDEAVGARAADEAARAAVERAEAGRATVRAELIELERSTGDRGGRLAELERAAQATAIEASRVDEALAALGRERDLALDSLPDTDADVPTEEIDSLSDEALDNELRRARRTLSQIGSVNPFAVEEHREIAARLDEISSQDADLRGAIAGTEELMARLDAEIGDQFDAAFRAIGEKFDEYCRLLFAGGSASLQMGDEADGDAPGGIEIVVRPPGKRLQRLAMLSGGERALTGVALLFAMLTVNPVPFCILDEVDAALDEANIGRFADALRRLAESIDFVVITHNRATIEVADTIYGVTMTDAAVSRVLSLRLTDVPAAVPA